MSNSWRPHRLQHTWLPCPSPIPRAYSNPCPSSQWYHPTISSSVVPFSSCLQSFPASGSFQMSQFFASGGQSVGVSVSASVLPMNIQDWYPLGWTGWISLLSKVYHSCFNLPSPPHHGLQHTRLPCPSPAPRACSVSCSLSQWGHGHESEQAVLIFKATSMMFSIVTVTVYKGSLLSTASPTLHSYLWKVAILTGMLWSDISLWFDLHFLDDQSGWAPSHGPVGHLYIFFRNMSTQDLCPFFIRLFAVLPSSMCFSYFRYESLIRYVACKYFLPFHRLPFHFVVSFAVQNIFSLT